MYLPIARIKIWNSGRGLAIFTDMLHLWRKPFNIFSGKSGEVLIVRFLPTSGLYFSGGGEGGGFKASLMSDFQITKRLKVIPLDVLVTKRSVGRSCAVTVNYHDYSIGSVLEITAQIKFLGWRNRDYFCSWKSRRVTA